MKEPAISVIVPVYKAEKYLHRCVDSLLAQTFQDFEVLLVDDGSPDRSGEICDEYAKKDSRVRVFHKENGGVSSARNVGLSNAIGEYLTFIDADDWIDVDCFEEGYSLLRREYLDILQYSYRKVSEEGRIISIHHYECVPMNWKDFVRKDHFLVCVWGNYIRTSIIKKCHLCFDEKIHLAEDQLFIMRAMTLSNRIAQTNRIYYNYFQNSGSATHNSQKKDIIESSKELLRFENKYYMFKPHIDRMIAYFYVDFLSVYKVSGEELDRIYCEAKIQFRNLYSFSSRLLYISSFAGMKNASKVIVSYLALKRRKCKKY